MMWLRCIAVILFTTTQIHSGYSKLQFIQTLTRHGDRAPIGSYPWDKTPPDFWPEGYAKLTKLGKKQNYGLGKTLRSLYKGFITSNPNEVLVNSTNLDRCIISATTLMSSFYAPNAEWAFDENVDWQPIQINYQPYYEDRYLSLEVPCPRFYEEMGRKYKSQEYFQIAEKYKSMLVTLPAYIGPLELLGSFEKFEDNLSVNKQNNLSIPTWAELLYDQIKGYSRATTFLAWTSPEIIRLRAGLLLGKIIDDMKRKVSGEISNLKVQVYSAVSHNLIPVMSALGVFNDLLPPHCATVIFELHKTTRHAHAVRLLYLNSTHPELGVQVPRVLTLEGCSEYCPLNFFVSHVRKYVPKDYDRDCESSSVPSVGTTRASFSAFIVLFCICVSSIYFKVSLDIFY